jgi:hypothetical protein
MRHPIHRVTGFERIAPFILRVQFEDASSQVIDFRPVLSGEIYGPLGDARLFDQVRLDEVAHTLVWPNGADFDPAILHDWPTAGRDLAALVLSWTHAVR